MILFCYLFIQVSVEQPSPNKACMAAAKELEKEQEAELGFEAPCGRRFVGGTSGQWMWMTWIKLQG